MPKKKAIKLTISDKKIKQDTRMIAQYFQEMIKYVEKYGKKTILLWQSGTFYEIYTIKDPDTDEFLLSEFDEYIKLTHMNIANKHIKYEYNGKSCSVFMAGFNNFDYLLEKWVKVLTDGGFTVPVWYEYKSVGKKKDRKLLQIFSPGCFFQNNKLESEDCNNIACYSILQSSCSLLTRTPSLLFGCANLNIYTGNLTLFNHEVKKQNIHNPVVFDELERFNSIYEPQEIIFIHNYKDENKLQDILKFSGINCRKIHFVNQAKEGEFTLQALNAENQTYQEDIMCKFYDIPDYDSYLESSTLNERPIALKSLCFLLNFINDHNAKLTQKIHLPTFDNKIGHLHLANHSLNQLNIVDTAFSKGPYSSVEKLVNKCETPMGRRSFKEKLLHPVTDVEYLQEQYDIMEYFIDNWDDYSFLRKKLSKIKDIEYLYRKIIFQKVEPIELYQFFNNLNSIYEIHEKLEVDDTINEYITNNIDIDISNVCEKLKATLAENMNMDVCKSLNNNKYEINFMNIGINDVLDEVVESFQKVEKEKQDLCKFFDKYVNIGEGKGKSNENMTKIHFTEKGTMYMYLTSVRATHLKVGLEKEGIIKYDIKYEKCKGTNKMLGGSIMSQFYNKYVQKKSDLSEILERVYKLFVEDLKNFDKEMFNFVDYVSLLDVITTKSFVSKNENYCKPIIRKKSKAYFDAKDLVHPILNHIANETYIPNDVCLGNKNHGMLIYGTNGVGKSSINKSIGIAIIMAQSGMYVPASSFIYYPYNAIFTRIIGNDNLFKNLSTFAVEMSECSSIINMSDQNSLILGDEVCSGTENRSANSIFAQTLLWLEKTKSTYIFATHFHDILNWPSIKKMKYLSVKHMSVECLPNGTLVYTRKLEDGNGMTEYGLEVCKSFDFPEEFTKGAFALRNKHYHKKTRNRLKSKKSSYNSKILKGDCFICGAEGVDIHHLSPQETADVNNYIGSFHKNHKANLANICKPCHLEVTKNNIIHRKTKTTEGYKHLEQ
uniref:DNA mismatch repair proteins mutS family domain-containing protein n=1 Tax=viral metagenome TaxID=1070528 RepID=A0A6C0KDJ5_9ZZZZ